MKRRSFLGLLLAAPVTALAAAKAVAAPAEPAIEAQALNIRGLTAINANFGTYTTGVIASPDGSFAIDFERHVMTITDDMFASLDRSRREAFQTIRENIPNE